MAFLIPALIAAGEAAALGGVGALGAKLVGKIIGDAPLSEPDMLEVVSYLGDPGNENSLPRMSIYPDVMQDLVSARLAVNSLDPAAQAQFRSDLQLISRQLASKPHYQQGLQASQGIADAAAIVNMNPELQRQPPPLLTSAAPTPQWISPTGVSVYTPRQAQQMSSTYMGTALGQQVVNPPQELGALTAPSQSPIQQGAARYTPTVNPYQAQQPLSKLITNQGFVIPRPSAEGNPGSTGTNGQSVKDIAYDTARGVGVELQNAASEAGINLINRAGTAAAGVGSSLIQKGGKFLGQKMGELASMLARKIVGDAPPSQMDLALRIIEKQIATPNMLGRDGHGIRDMNVSKVVGDALPDFTIANQLKQNKIVGDAPPMDNQEGMMTTDQVDAALLNLTTSPTFALLSMLIIEEQMMINSEGLGTLLEARDANNHVARLVENVSGTYRMDLISSIRSIEGDVGGWANYPILQAPREEWNAVPSTPDGSGHDTKNVYRGESYGAGAFMMSPTTASSSVPLLASATLQALGPLSLGASLSEYTRELRLTTATFSYDLTARLWSLCMDNVQNQMGYSFVRPLIVLLEMNKSRYFIEGNALGQYASNLYARPNNSKPYFKNQNVPYFPFDDGGWNYSTDRSAANKYNASWLKLAIMDESSFIAAATGLISTTDWDDKFKPNTWGSNCAVVFVPQSKKKDWQFIAAWACCFLAYPVIAWGRNYDLYTRTATGNLEQMVESQPYECCNTGNALAGPSNSILFVVVGCTRIEMAELALDAAGFAINGTDHNPTSPFTRDDDALVFDNFLEYGSRPNIFIVADCIRFWEEVYGTSSERSSAMRIVADSAYVFYEKNYFGNAQLPGQEIKGEIKAVHHFGTGANFARSFTRGDLNWNLNDAKQYEENQMRAMTSWAAQTPLLRTPVWRVISTNGVANPFSTYDDGSTLFHERNIYVDLLVMKKLATPAEEYPLKRLGIGSPLSMSLAAMNNMMVGVVDAAMQANNVPSMFAIFPSHYSGPNEEAFIRFKVPPVISQIIEHGIQYPAVTITRSRRSVVPENIISDSILRLYPTAVINVTTLTSLSRISATALSQYTPAINDYNAAFQLGVADLSPRLNIYNGLLPNGWQGSNYYMISASSDDKITDKFMMALVRNLSRGMLVDANNLVSTNYGMCLLPDGGSTAKPIYVHLTHYDHVNATIFAKTQGNNSITIPPGESSMIPHNDRIMRREPESAFRKAAILMTGPRELFSPGSGPTTAYRLFSEVNSPANIQTTHLWNSDNTYSYAQSSLSDIFMLV